MPSSKRTPKPSESDPYLITYDELAARTNLSRRSWERQVNKGIVPGVTKIGHSVRFNWTIVKVWLDEQGNA